MDEPLDDFMQEIAKINQRQAERLREMGYPKFKDDGEPIYPEDEICEPLASESYMMFCLEQAILAGEEPPAKQVGELIRVTAPVEIPHVVREYIASILAPQAGQQRKVGGNRGKSLMDRINPDPRKVFARIGLDEHLGALRSEFDAMKTAGMASREAYERLAKLHNLHSERTGRVWGHERVKKYLRQGE